MKVCTEAVSTQVGILVSCLPQLKLDVRISMHARLNTHSLFFKTHSFEADLFSSVTLSNPFRNLGFVDKFP